MLWCTTLTALPSLWTHLDLAQAYCSVSINTIRHYIVRSKNGLTRASVFISKKRDDVMWCDALLRCPSLRHLDINLVADSYDCALLKSAPSFAGLQILVVTACSVPFDRVIKLLGSCKKLNRAEFSRVKGPINDAEWTDDVSGIRSLAIKADMEATVRVNSETLVSSILHPLPDLV